MTTGATARDRVDVWWTRPTSSGGRKSEISPYLAEPYEDMTMLKSMAWIERTFNRAADAIPEDRFPTDLRWQLRKVTDKERDLPDAQKIYMPAIMVSEAFRDVAVQFDLGKSQFIEAPLYAARSMTRMGEVEIDRRDLRRWFLFQILPRKTALMPEASSGISFSKWPDQSIRWSVNVPGTPDSVLDPAAAEGPDIWHDPDLTGVIFFSDRLKRAIRAARFRTPAFAFEPCRLI